MMSSPPPQRVGVTKLYPPISSQSKSQGWMRDRITPLIHVFIHPLADHPHPRRTHSALWREPPTRAPLRSRIGNFAWELQFPGVLEGSLRPQRSEFHCLAAFAVRPLPHVSSHCDHHCSSAQLRVPTSLAASWEYEKPAVADCDVLVSMRFKTSPVSPCSVACAARNEVK